MKKEFIFYIDEDGIRNKSTVKSGFDLPIGRYKAVITPSNKRSLAQNNWLHAILPDILQGLRDAGYNLRNVEDAKNVVKSLFFKTTVSNGIEEIEVVEHTSETSKEIFSERAERIIEWAKDYLGIDIAPPAQQIEIFQWS